MRRPVLALLLLSMLGGCASGGHTIKESVSQSSVPTSSAKLQAPFTPIVLAHGSLTITPGSQRNDHIHGFVAPPNNADLAADSEGLSIIGEVADLSPSDRGSYVVCSRTGVDENLEDDLAWSDLEVGRQFCLTADDPNVNSVSLLTVVANRQLQRPS